VCWSARLVGCFSLQGRGSFRSTFLRFYDCSKTSWFIQAANGTILYSTVLDFRLAMPATLQARCLATASVVRRNTVLLAAIVLQDLLAGVNKIVPLLEHSFAATQLLSSIVQLKFYLLYFCSNKIGASRPACFLRLVGVFPTNQFCTSCLLIFPPVHCTLVPAATKSQLCRPCFRLKIKHTPKASGQWA
jgi:hypothetical protein